LSSDRPIEVAVIGGGCAGITAAFELSRPEHDGRYRVTVYQQGWRLGGKGASGRGPAGRIEEHGLHVWLGFYENAFRLLRECYDELGRDPSTCPIAHWRDAFTTDPYVGVVEHTKEGEWQEWLAYFPPRPGLPGDPLTEENPFTMSGYLARSAALLFSLLVAAQEKNDRQEGPAGPRSPLPRPDELPQAIARLLRYGQLATLAAVVEGAGLLAAVFRFAPQLPTELITRLVEQVATSARQQLEKITDKDDETRRIWQVIDLCLAIVKGSLRFGLLTDPRGFDAINEYDCRQWLELCGASKDSTNCAFVRGLYDLAFGYEDGDIHRPRLAAGQALRGAVRMFFTYRGALFWKMNAGMGDIVFAPFYEVLKARGVRFEFFHRLRDVKLKAAAELLEGERPYVEELAFDVQARTLNGGEYEPLYDVHGLPCWPSKPRYEQLEGGAEALAERDFESHWDNSCAERKVCRVGDHFDAVVLAVGIAAVPYVCRDLLERDPRWRAMVDNVKTVATQAFQVWMNEDMESLGWPAPSTTLSGYVSPFDTWADMRQVIPYEDWPQGDLRAIAYFCSALATPEAPAQGTGAVDPASYHEAVRRNAIGFLERDVTRLWPGAERPGGGFRWELLLAPPSEEPTAASSGEKRFDSQYWTANVNPTDRYTLCLPGSLVHRISPLDNTYDNLTIAGDWTECGFNEGCVEAAVMSGRLAAHAIALSPALEDIIGYDHP